LTVTQSPKMLSTNFGQNVRLSPSPFQFWALGDSKQQR